METVGGRGTETGTYCHPSQSCEHSGIETPSPVLVPPAWVGSGRRLIIPKLLKGCKTLDYVVILLNVFKSHSNGIRK